MDTVTCGYRYLWIPSSVDTIICRYHILWILYSADDAGAGDGGDESRRDRAVAAEQTPQQERDGASHQRHQEEARGQVGQTNAPCSRMHSRILSRVPRALLPLACSLVLACACSLAFLLAIFRTFVLFFLLFFQFSNPILLESPATNLYTIIVYFSTFQFFNLISQLSTLFFN